jgi:hypothetical protein
MAMYIGDPQLKGSASLNFTTPEIAQAAIEKLNDADPFNCGSPMYIAIHKSKFQRQQQANV